MSQVSSQSDSSEYESGKEKVKRYRRRTLSGEKVLIGEDAEKELEKTRRFSKDSGRGQRTSIETDRVQNYERIRKGTNEKEKYDRRFEEDRNNKNESNLDDSASIDYLYKAKTKKNKDNEIYKGKETYRRRVSGDHKHHHHHRHRRRSSGEPQRIRKSSERSGRSGGSNNNRRYSSDNDGDRDSLNSEQQEYDPNKSKLDGKPPVHHHHHHHREYHHRHYKKLLFPWPFNFGNPPEEKCSIPKSKPSKKPSHKDASTLQVPQEASCSPKSVIAVVTEPEPLPAPIPEPEVPVVRLNDHTTSVSRNFQAFLSRSQAPVIAARKMNTEEHETELDDLERKNREEIVRNVAVAAVKRQDSVDEINFVTGGDCPFCGQGKFKQKFTWTGIMAAILLFPCGIYCCFKCRVQVCTYCGISPM